MTLSVFSVRDIDLSKIESRPFRPGSFATSLTPGPSTPKAADANGSGGDGGEHAAKKQKAEGSSATTALQPAEPEFLYAFYVDLLVSSSEER